MPAPTYSLAPKTIPESPYYSSMEELANEVLDHLKNVFRPVLDFIPVACPEQACLDLLLFGVYGRRGLKSDEKPKLEHLTYVLEQLQKSGDYTYQIQRCRAAQKVFLDHSTAICSLIWHLINNAVDWFAERSNEVLGAYTVGVDSFLTTLDATPRSDRLFLTSPVLEYHVNMVGAEILNALWKKDFAATQRQLVVLPSCLQANPINCKAKQWVLGFKCTQCDPDCQINELSRLGEHYGFEVAFVKHLSSLGSHVQGLSALEQSGSWGILGVACVLSLLEGGFMLDAHNVPAQCVPLDYCGCTNHWHKDGLTTSVNVARILELVGDTQSG